jgi:hypothetical protein
MIIVLVLLLAYYVVDSGILSRDQKAAIEETVGTAETAEKTEDIINTYTHIASVAEISWTGSWEKDPFFYAPKGSEGEVGDNLLSKFFGSAEEGARVNMELTGISWLGNSGYALINESVVKEGDVIGGYTVDLIAFNYVILKQGMKTIRLTLNE